MSDIYLKIHEGTGRLSGVSLCKSCAQSVVWEDARGEHTVCTEYGMTNRPIQGKVMRCSHYYNKALPTREDFQASAWTLRTDKWGKNIGFAPPPKDKGPGTPTRD